MILSEIEESCIYQSSLSMKYEHKTIETYCLLTESHFIILKRKTDVVSFKQILISEKAKVEYQDSQNQFAIIVGNFHFTFSNQSIQLIETWVKKITHALQGTEKIESRENCYHAEVKIDQLTSPNQEVYILIGYDDYKLYIFESLEYHRYDVATHIVNLKYYKIKENIVHRASNLFRSATKSIRLIGPNIQLKLSFKDEEMVSKWKNIIENAIKNSFLSKQVGVLQEIYENKSNTKCADCGYCDPEWVSINFCIAVCINCAGLHRSIGTSYSRIQSAIIDQRIWEDCQLVKLIQQIGNKRSNSFWLKCRPDHYQTIQSYDDPNFIRDKYVNKVFMDREFSELSEDELIERLKASVSESDVFLTLRLWQSIDFRYDDTFVDMLLDIARDRQQVLQEKFLSLQPQQLTSVSDSPDSVAAFELVVQIALNSAEKLNNLFLVALQKNCISIKTESVNLSQMEMIEVCCIQLNDVTLVWYDIINESLTISIESTCSFATSPGKSGRQEAQDVDRITLFSKSRLILKKFKTDLVRALLSSDLVALTDESNLFANVHVQLNSTIAIRCKCCVADHELILDKPISVIYNLKKCFVQQCVSSDNDSDDGGGGSVLVRMTNGKSELLLLFAGKADQQIVYNCLETATTSIKLSSENESIPIAVDKMISFISTRGLRSEGILRIEGSTKKINNLFNSIEQMGANFLIDPTIYSVNDVASCLKRYFRSLEEPLIPVDLFQQFETASQQRNDDNDDDNTTGDRSSASTKTDLYREALSQLPVVNYRIFRRILELFLMIRLTRDANKMDTDSLAISTASSFISFDAFNVQANAMIMRDLIENFRILFDYSEKEYEILNRFMNSPEPPSKSVIRTFYVERPFEDSFKKKALSHEKLPFLSKDITYLSIHINMDQCAKVKHVHEKIFIDVPLNGVDLWHFLTNDSGFFHETVKRLVHCHEDVHQSIVFPRTLPGYTSGYFVFLTVPNDTGRTEWRLFQCKIKLKRVSTYQNYVLMLSYPSSLQIYGNDNHAEQATFEFSLSDFHLYQFHEKNVKKIFILHDQKGVFQIKFCDNEELRQFLYFYDQFRRKNSC